MEQGNERIRGSRGAALAIAAARCCTRRRSGVYRGLLFGEIRGLDFDGTHFLTLLSEGRLRADEDEREAARRQVGLDEALHYHAVQARRGAA